MAKFSDEAVSKILQGRRVVSPVPFPGRPDDSDLEVGIRSLSDREIDMCRIEAQVYLQRICKQNDVNIGAFIAIDPDALDREHQRQVLAMACVDVESGDKQALFFDSAKQVRDLDSVAVARLWEAYQDHQDAVNPRHSLTEAEAKELADALGKEPTATAILAAYERATLCSLVRTLASQLRT